MNRVGKVEVEVVVVMVMRIDVDVDVYTTFQQSHVIKRDPKIKSAISLHITQ